MITISEFSKVLNLSKERTKQLIDSALLQNPDLPVQKEGIWQIGHQTVEFILSERNKPLPVRQVFVCKSAKGGVSGTTILFETAVFFSKFLKVLVIDADAEAHISNLLLSESTDYTKTKCLYDVFSEKLSFDDAIVKTKYPNLDLIPSALRNHKTERLLAGQNPKKIIKSKIEEMKNDYSIIFIDLPPTIGSTLVQSCYLASDKVFLPCIPSTFSLESIALTKETVEKLCAEFDVAPKHFKIIFSQYSNKTIASQEILSALLNEYKGLVNPIYIPHSSAVVNSLNAGLSIYEIQGSKEVKDAFSNLSLSMIDWV